MRFFSIKDKFYLVSLENLNNVGIILCLEVVGFTPFENVSVCPITSCVTGQINVLKHKRT